MFGNMVGVVYKNFLKGTPLRAMYPPLPGQCIDLISTRASATGTPQKST